MDVKQEADIVEEILRIYGLNNIEERPNAGADFISGFPSKDPDKFKQSIGTLLASNGFFEIMTNSLTHAEYMKYAMEIKGKPVEITQQIERRAGHHAYAYVVHWHWKYVPSTSIANKKDLKLFEFGKVYAKQEGKYSEKNGWRYISPVNMSPMAGNDRRDQCRTMIFRGLWRMF